MSMPCRGSFVDAPLLVARLGLAGDFGLGLGACEERVSVVLVRANNWLTIYLEFSTALHCEASLGAYQ